MFRGENAVSRDDDMRGYLTELEIESGVYSILYGKTEDEDFPSYTEEANGPHRGKHSIDPASLKEGAKIIAGLENRKQIQQRLIHKLLRDETDYAITRYLVKEAVPAEYGRIVKTGACIETLVKGIFYKVCKIRRSDSLDIEIAELCGALKKNERLSIVYDRVGMIQKFVHLKVDEICGEGSHVAIPAKHMKNLLSVARLHLNLSDLRSRDESYSLYMDALSRSAADFEYSNPKTTSLPAGKRFIPKWRVRHLKPLSHFYTRIVRQKIAGLRVLDEQLPLETYATAALAIYATSISA